MTSFQSAPVGAAEPMALEEAEIALQIPSDAEFVRVVRLAVMGVASRMPFSYDDIEDIKLAVSEACNNAILHARVAPEQIQVALGANADGVQQTEIKPPIVVRFQPLRDRLEISVEDGGRISSPGFGTPRPRKPIFSPDDAEIPESGMGLFLIQSLMDEVQHHSGEASNTVIYMTKYLPQREASRQSATSDARTDSRADSGETREMPSALAPRAAAEPERLPTS